jgi:hypothetical protein
MAGEVSKYAMESAYKDVERDALARTTAQEIRRRSCWVANRDPAIGAGSRSDPRAARQGGAW